MKYKIILAGLVAALMTGCSSAYKASQTPDDVYFSPARKVNAQKQTRNEDRYEDYVSSQEDQYLRMKIRDRNRWSVIDDYTYWNDSRYVPSYSYNYYRNNWNNFYSWNNPYSWNNWSSPYYNTFYSGSYGYYNAYPPFGFSTYTNPYSNVYISKYPVKVAPNVSRPSLNSYRNRTYSNSNATYGRPGLGDAIKRVFTPNVNNNTYSNRNINTNNNTNNTYKAPERSYTPSAPASAPARSSGTISRPSRN